MIENLSPGGNGGDATDEKAKVSANDTTAGFLNGKLVAGTNITLTENNNGGDETLTIAAAGGVTGFTGSQNTASPNNTVNASRLLVDAGTTNADAVIQPKGTGAFQLQLADSTSTGGNKRGARAVDLVLTRTLAQQVASGANSFAVGPGATASGTGAMAIGNGSRAQGNDSVALGTNTTASDTGSVAIGESSTASGSYSFAIGLVASATAASTIALGDRALAARTGMLAHASGQFAAVGDAQYERYILRRATTNATPTELFTDNSGIRIQIASDATYVFHAYVVARRTDVDNESAGYEIKGVIDNNAGTTAFVGTPTTTVLAEDTAAWDIAVTADNTNDALVFTATGEAAKTIRWVATVHLTKVTG
jgi:hypothetical protein